MAVFHDSVTDCTKVTLEFGNRYVGQKAKDRRLSGSTNIAYSVKRFIGRDFDDPKTKKALEKVSYSVRKAQNGEVEIKLGESYYNPVEISAMILEKLKKDAEQELGEEVTHAVITVPAYFSQRQKNATREAGQMAGLNVLRIINEPTAAALAFGVEENLSETQYVLVYDLGGGTFDVSILIVSAGNYEVLRIDGDNFLGGDDFDNLIIGEMIENIRRDSGEDFSSDEIIKNILKGHAEQIKINLSRDEQSRVAVPAIAKTRKGSPVNLDYSLSRARFEQMISTFVEESITIVQQALEKENLSAEEIDRVLLVGGSTRIPIIRSQLKKVFGDRIEIEVDPMQCVALGAAIQTAIPIEWMCPNCNTVNEGMDELCRNCRHIHQDDAEKVPTIVCDACGKSNRQGRLDCWACGTKIGAVLEFDDEDLEEDTGNSYIRIGDITSKYLGVEVVGNTKLAYESSHNFATLIPKGTPFPTHEPYYREFFTNRAGQEQIYIPIFEIEHEDSNREEWEYVGSVINDKIPPGTPTDTPVMVEMRIDGDGILTVTSYLKRMKEDTIITKSLHFGSKEVFKNENESEVLESLWALGFILGAIAEVQSINKHLYPEQINLAKQASGEARAIAEAKEEARAKPALDLIRKQIEELPPPAWDLFWSYWAMSQEQISAGEKSQVNKTIMQMENAAVNGDIDEANRHLSQLRKLNQAMLDKIPSTLRLK